MRNIKYPVDENLIKLVQNLCSSDRMGLKDCNDILQNMFHQYYYEQKPQL